MKAHKNEGSMKPQVETRLALLEQSNTHINETLKRIDTNIISLHQQLANSVQHLTERMDSKFDFLEKKMDAKFEGVDKKFDHLDKKISSLNDKIDSNFKYVITTMLTLFVASGLMPAIVSAIQKWLH